MSGGYGAYGGPPSPASGTTVDAAGFLKSLFDFRFDHFVTPKAIRFIYIVWLALMSLTALLYLVLALASGEPFVILLALIFVPITFLVYVILTRMMLELFAALFRIADDLRAIRQSRAI